ncbi:LysR family transcriptional regulator ArgP [Actinotalea sp.]|uniref:LysR family transcriptional regulator ArgP n=1 Tax=Actinotalea sp. TaxID=1872145 RepID=UPI002CDF9867|nr:LysR family transcriptional regulator ArgP [Actinotalea sp.]HQY33737.1 LysR family transcriptional regulator ArgP [Actinotalea sp.]HRA51243.1 LysR family transcriptional regulator ArgP [Actinotalea sp.]
MIFTNHEILFIMELDRAQLAALAAVVDAGSFEAAAQRLHLTPSAVSQRIKALEQRTGQVVVRRARPCRATGAGEVLVRLAGQLALLEREAGALLRGPGDGGPVTVTVAVNADSLDSWFAAALTGLPAGVLVDLRRADQDRSADLLRDGTAMAAVTADGRAVQGCRVRPLGAMRYLAVAAPSARWFADGVDGATLAAAPQVAFDRHDALQATFARALGARGPAPVHHVPSQEAFVAVVRAGLGWGMVPSTAAQGLLDAGELAEVLPGRHLDVPLFWQHWKVEAPTLLDLTARVVAAAGAALQPAHVRGSVAGVVAGVGTGSAVG